MRASWIAVSLAFVVIGCKFGTPTGSEIKAQDHLARDFRGPIAVKPGTPQFPVAGECIAAVNKAFAAQPKLTKAQLPGEGKTALVDLAWQFPDVKEQKYGDCYVYAGVAGVEAALNRVYLKKPQLSLSDPYMGLQAMTTPQGFEELKYRLVEPIATPGRYGSAEAFAGKVISGGFSYPIQAWALEHADALVFDNEYDYSQMEATLDSIRKQIEAKKVGKATFGDMARMVDNAQNALGLGNLPWLNALKADLVGGAGVKDLNQASVKASASYFPGRALGKEVQLAVDSLASGAVLQLDSISKETYDAGVALAAAHKAFHAPEPLAQPESSSSGDTGQSDVVDFGAGAPSDGKADEKKVPDAPTPVLEGKAKLEEALVKARETCDGLSATMRKDLTEALCGGIPVVVGMGMIGTEVEYLLQNEEGVSMSTDAPAGAGGDFSDGNDQNGPSQSVLDKLSGPSRGNAEVDPAKSTTITRPFTTDETESVHTNHAMVIDGIVKDSQGVLWWRFRNSWGNSGTAYVPVAETCRIHDGQAIILPGEPADTIGQLGKPREKPKTRPSEPNPPQ